MRKLNKPKDVFVFLSAWFLFIYLVIANRDERYSRLITEGRLAEGEIILSVEGKRNHIEYLYFDKIRDSCVIGKRHTDYSTKTMPLEGERYKVFYDENGSLLSVKDYLVKFRNSVVYINGDFYSVDVDTIDFEFFFERCLSRWHQLCQIKGTKIL